MSASPEDVRFADARKLGERIVHQLDQLRDLAPIYWSENQNAWIISGHAEVAEAFLNPKVFSSGSRPQRVLSFLRPEERDTRAPYLIASLKRMLFSLDAPEHPRIRRLMMKAFGRSVIEPYRDVVRRIIADALEDAARLGEFDYVPTVAHRIPSTVILKLLGLPDSFLSSMRRWSTSITAGIGGGGTTPEMIDTAEQAARELRDAFEPELRKRRAHPSGDFISTLIAAEENGERLTDEEILANCYLVLLAGHETTSSTIALSTLLLARDPSLWSYFQITEDPKALLGAVLELSRVIGMSFASARVISQDVEWQGHQFRKGQLVYLMQGVANRDPKVFPDPGAVDLNRPQDGNLSCGMGAHMCIGHLLAKLQLTEFFPQLTRRFARIEVLDRELDWGTSIGFRGLNSLRVRVHPQ